MIIIFVLLLIGKLLLDGVASFYSQAIVEAYNPYTEYRKQLAAYKESEEK